MTDITKCTGTKDTGDQCPIRDKCYRYTAPLNHFWQAFFVSSPWFNNQCEMYYDYTNNIHGYRFGDNDKESDKHAGPPNVAEQSHSEGGDEISDKEVCQPQSS